MKKHITICSIVGGLIIGGLTVIQIGKGDLMEYNTDYREKAVSIVSVIDNFADVPVLNTLYDLDGDGQYDVSELRLIQYVDTEGNAYSNLEPIVYGFDMNQDGQFGEDEAFIDLLMNGLNGDEVKASDYGRQKTSV